MLTCLQEAVAQAEEFVHGDAPGLERHQQSGDLAVVETLLRDTEKDFMCLLTGEALSFDELFEVLFHFIYVF